MLSSGEIEVAGVREEHPTIFSPLDIVAICLGGMPAINIALAPLSLSLSASPLLRARPSFSVESYAMKNELFLRCCSSLPLSRLLRPRSAPLHPGPLRSAPASSVRHVDAVSAAPNKNTRPFATLRERAYITQHILRPNSCSRAH